MPRKAAYFAAVAAEAVSEGSAKQAGDLWLLATQLYSREPGKSYGWGVLRAACLSALAAKGRGSIGLEASEQLLSLLAELKPCTEPEETNAEDSAEMPATSTHGSEDKDSDGNPKCFCGKVRSAPPLRARDQSAGSLR